jgi:LPS O-antigen subunit length determinant protein (WzzB/FepE family)
MKNATENHETMSARRLTYLTEQAEIARKLNIAKNNILESQSFRTDTAVITTLISEIPYYMRGYEMIEKEIELIKSRVDSKAFIQIFSKLEKKLRKITSNKDIKRLETLFKKTPVNSSDDFYAAKIMFQSTEHEIVNKRNSIKILFLAGLIGAILGIFYILMTNAIQNRR